MPRLVILLVACACACASSPASAPANRVTPSDPLAEARAAERGTGMPRDYERAAQIYERLCDRGHGSIAACLELIDAIVDARGAAADVRRVYALNQVLCARGEALACVGNAYIDAARGRPLDETALEGAAKRLVTACEHGDGRACEATVSGGDGSSAERDRRTKFSVACLAGRMDACGHVLIELDLCGEPEVDDVAGCERGRIADWQSHDYDRDRVANAKKLYDECRAGEARACQHIPTQRIAMATLCAAHDYGACARLGCIGDDAAKAVALAHGADRPNCYVAHKDALLEWKLHPTTRFPPLVTDGRGPIGGRPTPPWEAVRFQFHGGRDPKDWPRFDVYNLNDRAITELSVCLYAYDATDNQLAWFAARATGKVAPNALVPLVLDATKAPRLPDGAIDYVLDYDHVVFEGSAPSEDRARCPAKRPHSQQGAYMRW